MISQCSDLNIRVYKKNDIIELEITDMTKEGLGLAKASGQVFFVKDGIVGDKVKAVVTKLSPNIIYAKATELIDRSPYRVDTNCKISNACGGCSLLNLNYDKELELKKTFVLNCLKKIGKFDVNFDNLYEGILKMQNPYNFRNKMQVPFAVRNGEIIYGFYAGRTHYIIELEECIVGFKGAKIILDSIKKALKKFNISIYDEQSGRGIFRQVLLRKGNVSNEISITYILNDADYEKNLDLYKDFGKYVVDNAGNNELLITSTININLSNNNVIFGNKNVIIRGKGYIEDSISNIKYHISPESFYQVNSEMTKVLYDKVLEYADFNGSERVLDLYCGIGTISLYLAKYVKEVLGIEIVKSAVDNAKDNARINRIDNAKFLCLDADKIDSSEKNGLRDFDTVIVDPPRKGLDITTINFIKGLNPKKIIYVSCDPATLSRDLGILCHGEDSKFTLKRIANVDMFPHTMHVETVSLLIR